MTPVSRARLAAVALASLFGALLWLRVEAEAEFEPQFVRLDLGASVVRPGAELEYELHLRNAGSRPAAWEQQVFVHLEPFGAGCLEAVAQDDHPPLVPATEWGAGYAFSTGARRLFLPDATPAGRYVMHVGVFDPGSGGARTVDVSTGAVEVDAAAIAPPAALASEAIAEAQAAEADGLRRRIGAAAALETARWRFTLARDAAVFLLEDLASGKIWTSDPWSAQLGEVALRRGGVVVRLPIEGWDRVERVGSTLEAEARVTRGTASMDVSLRVSVDDVVGGVRLTHAVQPGDGWEVSSVRFPQAALPASHATGGEVYLARGLGQLVRADGRAARERLYATYGKLSMAMCGVASGGSALLAYWESEQVALGLNSRSEPSAWIAEGDALALSWHSPQATGSLVLCPLGAGDYVDVAQAYRRVASERGWRVTRAQKGGGSAAEDPLAGAAQFKPCLFQPLQPHTPGNPSDERRELLRYTFDEVGRIARHWRTDLEIERSLVTLAGWSRAGYDNQLPTILPASERVGGNAGLVRCAQTVQAQGFAFALHDNVQDMFLDSPDYDAQLLNRGPGGVARKGGLWSGGESKLVCSGAQIELAAEHARALGELCAPDAYFLDASLAWGLVTCDAPDHPATVADDLRNKLELCERARAASGRLGLEGCRERAVPLADYFEGPLGSRLRPQGPRLPLPLFEMVFGDCVRSFGRQDHLDRLGPAQSRFVLDHLVTATLPTYRVPAGLYFESGAEAALELRPEVTHFEDLGDDAIEIAYAWNVQADVAADLDCFVHVLATGAEEEPAAFGDYAFALSTHAWRKGARVGTPPGFIQLPARDGTYRLVTGLSNAAGQRVELVGPLSPERRYPLGELVRSAGAWSFTPAPWSTADWTFARGDGGWGAALGQVDRTIKNSWEVLSPVQQITWETPMTDHAYLTFDGSVERAAFGELEVVVNRGREAFAIDGVELPPLGFLVRSPTYVAYHATRYAGVSAPAGMLFTLRSLDGRPLEQSRSVRIYHGFGDDRVRLGNREFRVAREAVVDPRGGAE